jgi:hypothetical protein
LKKRIVLVLGALVVGGMLYLKYSHHKQEILEEEADAAQEDLKAKGLKNFSLTIDELDSKGLINNKEEYITEFQNAYSNSGVTHITALASTTYHSNPSVGLEIFEAMCRDFTEQADMNEMLPEVVNKLLLKDKDTFVSALTGLPESKFQCLPQKIDLQWTDFEKLTQFDAPSENKKLARSLQSGKFSNHPNVKKLIEALNGA